jgi:hypothetical protein
MSDHSETFSSVAFEGFIFGLSTISFLISVSSFGFSVGFVISLSFMSK